MLLCEGTGFSLSYSVLYQCLMLMTWMAHCPAKFLVKMLLCEGTGFILSCSVLYQCLMLMTWMAHCPAMFFG